MFKNEIMILKKTIKSSYSPYSKFQVSCLIVTNDDKHYVGTNVENSSFALTICAEAAAISNAISNGQNMSNIKRIFIFTNSSNTITPCGACRQILFEIIDDNTEIVTIGNDNQCTYKISELLPGGFKLHQQHP